MLSKNQLKDIRVLHISKYRRKEQKFIAEGPKIIKEFLNSSYNIESIYAIDEWVNNNIDAHPNINKISAKELQAISLLKTPNQVVAIITYPEVNELIYKADELILALDTIQDPGNLGTIIRIADWFEIKKLVCSNETADAYNPKVVQASMGAITRVQFVYTDLNNWLQKLPKEVDIYGTLLDGESIYETKLNKEGIIIIGNESQGISANLRKLVNKRIKIPAYGDSLMESLNAAVATSIVCAEFRRS